MDHFVTHSSDLLPRDVRLSRLGVLGQILDGLADDLELAKRGILAHPIGEERAPTTERVRRDVLQRLANMFEVGARPSQSRGFRENSLLQIRAETSFRQDFNSSPKQFLQILLESYHIQQRPTGLDVHKEIDVAVRSIVAAGDRTEHTDILDAVADG